ncbi:unnamed protein product [Acanthoscelides obtectus]|uniref:Uncharacterized protein n=1 Tax=Acanthoscelides obtectus TaxID=200917 RepID=A0A9P0PFG5_ACAOB|nr:unnamed protein product [Acanthoscelides obtectus]CAK1667589.1 hypothetical protein AOBTE_LOCUS25935 [Acanthoscelides obtectus]
MLRAAVLLALLGAAWGGGKPPDHAADAGQRPPGVLGQPRYDTSSLYRIIPTSPPLQSANTPPLLTVPLTQETFPEPTTTLDVSADDHGFSIGGEDGPTKRHVSRYPVISVSFHRVETPFIIGLWIFFASLAKIGTLRLNTWLETL